MRVVLQRSRKSFYLVCWPKSLDFNILEHQQYEYRSSQNYSPTWNIRYSWTPPNKPNTAVLLKDRQQSSWQSRAHNNDRSISYCSDTSEATLRICRCIETPTLQTCKKLIVSKCKSENRAASLLVSTFLYSQMKATSIITINQGRKCDGTESLRQMMWTNDTRFIIQIHNPDQYSRSIIQINDPD